MSLVDVVIEEVTWNEQSKMWNVKLNDASAISISSIVKDNSTLTTFNWTINKESDKREVYFYYGRSGQFWFV